MGDRGRGLSKVSPFVFADSAVVVCLYDSQPFSLDTLRGSLTRLTNLEALVLPTLSAYSVYATSVEGEDELAVKRSKILAKELPSQLSRNLSNVFTRTGSNLVTVTLLGYDYRCSYSDVEESRELTLGRSKLLSRCVSFGIDARDEAGDGGTLLTAALAGSRAGTISEILLAGANPFARYVDVPSNVAGAKGSALHFAAAYGSTNTVLELLDNIKLGEIVAATPIAKWGEPFARRAASLHYTICVRTQRRGLDSMTKLSNFGL